ncbi:MAG TPA: uracil-DNA glycosylase [Thermoanaerobaculaceae bacterium]|nr:uracil-DNA glycosylase [Thermoanaerobaculaceae bacterium]
MSNPFPRAEKPRCDLVECRACPRLVAWREAQAAVVPRRFRAWVEAHGFWGRPVPAFGDPDPWLAIVGLAPAAQGANRTGRMFTGDRSGDFLFAALHRAGLASAPRSEVRGDGLRLAGVLITAPVRCAPPANRPLAEEVENCSGYLRADLAGCRSLRVVLALGGFAHAAIERLAREAGKAEGIGRFRHGAEWCLGAGAWLVDCYHVSQQNTFTGRLTQAMFDAVLARCIALRAAG